METLSKHLNSPLGQSPQAPIQDQVVSRIPGAIHCGHRDGGEGVKLEEQVLVTETGVRRMSTYVYSDLLTNS